VNKSQAIREYFGDHPSATPTQVVNGLKEERGLDVSMGLVSSIKYAKPKRRRKKKRVARKTVTVGLKRRGRPPKNAGRQGGGGLTAKNLFEAKKLVQEVGSIADARRALDALERLS
ncbi:MAG: hypothetical protein ACREJB_00045, partial [Planctomycetaceae bacterium]